MELESAGTATRFAHWRVAERFQVVRMGDGEYRLVSITQNIRIRPGNEANGILDKLLPPLEKGCHWRDLIELVGPDHEPEVSAIVDDLAGRGLLEQIPSDGVAGLDREEFEYYRNQTKFFSNFQLHGNEPPAKVDGSYKSAEVVAPQQRLKESKVLIAGLGKVGMSLAVMLARAGVGRIFGADTLPVNREDLSGGYKGRSLGGVRQEEAAESIGCANARIAYSAWPAGSVFEASSGDWPDQPGLLVLCEDQFNPEHYRSINQLCLKRSIPWISHRNLGFVCEVGPWIVPYETACYRCLELRKSANVRHYDNSLATQQRMLEGNATPGGLNFPLGCEVLALEVVKILAGFSRPMTYGSLFTFDLVSLESKLHAVLKVPRCAACGTGDREKPTVNIWRPSYDFEGL